MIPVRFVVAAMVAILLACAAAGVSPSKKVAMPPVLTLSDNGRTVNVPVGAEVALRLPENPSTGYGWAVEAKTNLVEISQREYVPMSNMVGGGGEARWLIRAKVSGTTTIRLKRWREWEGERSVVERYEFTLLISP